MPVGAQGLRGAVRQPASAGGGAGVAVLSVLAVLVLAVAVLGVLPLDLAWWQVAAVAVLATWAVQAPLLLLLAARVRRSRDG